MKKISLPIYIVSLLIILLICVILISLIIVNKKEDKGIKEEQTIEETYKPEDIYIEFGYKSQVTVMVYPAPDPNQWKYTITKDGKLFYYSNYVRGKNDYRNSTGETFVKKLDNETINKIESYINEKMSETDESTYGEYYIIMNNSGKMTFFKDLRELEKIINE